MNINIKATNMELTEAINDYVKKKLLTLEKFTQGDDIFGYVEVGKTTNHHKQGDFYKAEFDISFQGKRFFAQSESSDLYTAIDNAKDQIFGRITHTKDRKQTLFKRGATSVKKMLKGLSKRNPFTSKY